MTPKVRKTLPISEADRICAAYGFSSPQDAALEDLAMAMNIFVVDARLDTAAARLVREGAYGLIRVSDSIRHSGRRRFAIAHEIGHFVMHKHISQLLACTNSDMLASYQSSPYEVEASIFAGALLMPTEPFRMRISRRLPQTSVITELAAWFETSLTATALRYVETSKDYCVFVVSEDNRIRWWRASDAFGNHDLWLDNRSVLPRHSAAARFFRDGIAPVAPIEVEFEDWLGKLPEVQADYVLEQAIALPEYGQVISLIWLP